MSMKMAAALATGLAGASAMVSPASAAVVTAEADHMTLAYRIEVAGTPQAVFDRIVAVAGWWGSDHTYSGASRNLSIDPRAGGCWCERWRGGEVQHGRVVYAARGQALRVEAAFGPLQAMAVAGVMSFRLEADGAAPGTTRVLVRYVVNGTAASGLDRMAPVVDQVFTEQFARLGRLEAAGGP
jgi:uncharacterized protein YndB with AHSA1/START domain